MTIEEKFTGFSYQNNQKYHQEAVRNIVKKSWDKRSNAKRSRRRGYGRL